MLLTLSNLSYSAKNSLSQRRVNTCGQIYRMMLALNDRHTKNFDPRAGSAQKANKFNVYIYIGFSLRQSAFAG